MFMIQFISFLDRERYQWGGRVVAAGVGEQEWFIRVGLILLFLGFGSGRLRRRRCRSGW